ncbi:PREDICTED: 23S rRNA [Prunus dulcis]|uniref:PREDICTED: 23S rRNA n=1 Tax=Prunus dulcis TaxID=3755 RepID=A0A5E4FFV5_PRUDU|nr:PREDICTED: 23S rRNA [Prunus dulcis]
MPLCFLSVCPPPPPLITCHFSPSAVRAPPAVSAPAPASAAPSRSLSPNATPPPSLTCALHCPHFESCSGCTHEFNLHRPVIVDEATEFFKAVGVSDFTFDSCKLWGWRCRAKLAVRGSSENPLIGLYQEGTHNVVDIPQCKAHHPSINAAVQLLKQGITELSIEPYDEDEGTGDLRYVQMAVTTHDTSLPASERYKNGKVQVALVWNSRNENSPNSEKLNALANFIWRNGGTRSKVNLVHSVWANFQTSTNNIIFGNRWRHLLGERDFWEHVGGIDISLAPSSFGQANTRAFDTLLRKLQRYVPQGSSVADLYAGAGAIGLSLAVTRKCRSVRCIEINKESKLSFEKTVDRLPNLVDSSISWHLADTSKEPLSWITGSDVLVVDPPRKGLDASLVDALRSISSAEYKAKSSSESQLSSSSKEKDEKRPWMLRAREASVQIGSKITSEDSKTLPRTLIYISCGWESFKEDCELLLSSKAWKLEKAHGYNFFPGTQSIEVLAVFKRGQGVSLKKKKLGKKKKRL